MKYYVSEADLQALKKRGPFWEVWMSREKTDARKQAIDIAILASCHSCDEEFVLEENNEREGGDFCDACLRNE